jgi:hypothetical protein
VLVVLIALNAQQIEKYKSLRDAKELLAQQIITETKQLENTQKENAIQGLALNAARQVTSGPHPRVVFYRDSVGPQVREALGTLGFQVVESEYQGKSNLRNNAVDTLAYGCAVSRRDLQLIALALTSKSGVPIRRIVPAVTVREPMLVQLVASASSDPTSPTMSTTDIQRWSGETLTCPNRDSKGQDSTHAR